MGGLRRKFLGNHLITAKAKESAMKDAQKEENDYRVADFI